MDVLIVIVILGVLGLMAYGVLGLGFIGWASSKSAKTEERADDVLDELFDGAKYATYRLVIGALPFETVVIGATERGYALMHQTDEGKVKVLLFELRDPSKVPARPTPAPEPQPVGPIDQTGAWIIALGGGLIVAGLVFAVAIPQVAGVGYLASLFGVGLVIYGARERRDAHQRARDPQR